jgi:hypothetical protein
MAAAVAGRTYSPQVRLARLERYRSLLPMRPNEPRARIEEVTSVLTPAPGVTLAQAIADAHLAGFESIEIDVKNNRAVIRWYKRG